MTIEVRRRHLALLLAPVAALALQAASAQESYVGRPIYSEPATGLQMPPGCEVEPTWRSRMANSDTEVWVVSCGGMTHTWLLQRAIVEMLSASQARLRFQVMDDRAWPGDTPGDSVSVQCTGRKTTAAGYVVVGAKWRNAGNALRLSGARAALRGDPDHHRFVAASLNDIECTRYPEREAMMRRLQQAPR